jgi:hypothetical protein
MERRHCVTAVLALAATLALCAGPALGGVAKVESGIEFTYTDPYAASVSLAGLFNNWSMNATPLTMDDEGVWRVVITLPPGKHEYKFVVNGSEWVADPENPVVVGEYGNSQVVVGDDGGIVAAAVAASISNTAVNARVNINGWYRASYDTRSDVPSDRRWRLNRPAHEIYVSVNPTVNPKVSGSATVRLTTGAGDIKEITSDLYSGRVHLVGGPFSARGFYNEELVQFDEPFELVGHTDLAGTIEEEHIPFGRGAQGVIVDSEFWDSKLTAVYANQYDLDIYNDPSIESYDNTDTDLLAGRLTRRVGPVALGATYASLRDGWWIDYSANESPHLDEYIAETGTSSDWFELANTEQWIGIDADWAVPDLLYRIQAGLARYSYDSRWDMGNKEKVEGTDFTNGTIDVPVGDTEGWLGKLVLTGQPLTPLWLRLELKRLSVDAMDEGEEYVSFGSPPWAGEALRQFEQVRFSGSPLVVNVFDAAPGRDEWGYELDTGFGIGIFELGAEVDADGYEWSYSDTLPAWEGSTRRLATRAKADIEGERLWFELHTEAIWYDLDEGYWSPYDTRETILRSHLGFSDEWSLLCDFRHMTYRDVPGSDGAAFHRYFFNPYIGLVYSPRRNLELRVGYGVNPLSYIDTPVEGRSNGRERWRAQYMWDHSLADAIDAEQALEDARTIGVMAVIAF